MGQGLADRMSVSVDRKEFEIMKKTLIPRPALALVLLAWLVPAVAGAQGNPNQTGSQAASLAKFQYSAKFVCGVNDQDPRRVVPGWYATAVNVHNPTNKQISFRKKIALTYPPAEQRPGKVSQYIVDNLGPDEALAVDCEEIPIEFFGAAAGPYVKGYLVIESKTSLDVTAVYTAGTLGDAAGIPSVRSIDVERVPERRQ
jgi:hypothetical protein